MTQQPLRFISRYEVQGRLGRGGMGVVYLARDPHIDREVAIKLLHGEFATEDLLRRFALEARASGGLSHPNIITIHDFGEFEGSPFIVMERVRGETLAAKIERGTAVSIIQKLEWMEQVCAGLAHAHSVGIIHRDIKPSNLMVDQHNRIKVLDFGIARATGTGPAMMSMVIGTPGYMSPEQIQGGIIDARSDVFSVGAVMYEILAYRPAFPGDSPHTIMHRVLNTDPAPLNPYVGEHDSALIDVVKTALAKSAADRFPNMVAFQAAIARSRTALEVLGSALTRATPIPKPHPEVEPPRPVPQNLRSEAPTPKPTPKSEPRPEPKLEPKPEPKLEAKPEPKPKPTLEPKLEPKREPKAAPAPAPELVSARSSTAVVFVSLCIAAVSILFAAAVILGLRLPTFDWGTRVSGGLGSSDLAPVEVRLAGGRLPFVPFFAPVPMRSTASELDETALPVPVPVPVEADLASLAARAASAEAAGNLDRAFVEYSNVLRADATNVEAQRGLARIRAERRNTADRLVRRAGTRFEAGDYDGAIGDLTRALATAPGHQPAASLLEKVKLAKAAETRRRRVPPAEVKHEGHEGKHEGHEGIRP